MTLWKAAAGGVRLTDELSPARYSMRRTPGVVLPYLGRGYGHGRYTAVTRRWHRYRRRLHAICVEKHQAHGPGRADGSDARNAPAATWPTSARSCTAWARLLSSGTVRLGLLERHGHGQAAIGTRFKREIGAVSPGDRRHDGEPEAGAAVGICPVGTETLERSLQPGDLIRRDVRAAVEHGQE